MQGAQRSRKVTNQLMKRASEMWQSLTPFERESFKEAYQQQMEIFKTYRANERSEEEEVAERKKQRNKRLMEAKKETKEAKKKKKLLAKELEKKLLKEEVAGDECWPMKWRKRRMKKSVTGYFLFCKAKRRVVQTNLKTNEFSYLAKKLSEQWKELSDAQRYFWCREAWLREKYKEYIKSLKDESRKRRREHRRRQGAKRNKNL